MNVTARGGYQILDFTDLNVVVGDNIYVVSSELFNIIKNQNGKKPFLAYGVKVGAPDFEPYEYNGVWVVKADFVPVGGEAPFSNDCYVLSILTEQNTVLLSVVNTSDK